MRPALLGLILLAAALGPAEVHAQSLLDFYRHALQTNPTVRTRSFGVEQAKAQEDIAGSRLLPQLSASGNYNNNNYHESGLSAQSYNGSRSVIQASQALFDLASYFRLQSATFAVKQSELQAEAARMSLGGDVVDRYLSVLQAGDEMTHLLSEKASIEGQLKRLRFMRERGLVKVTDLFETEAYYQGLLTREIEAQSTRAVALERLREITGLAARQVAPLARESFPAVPGAEDQWVADAARNNPNLTALEKAMDAVRSQVKSARSDHLPVLSLQASKTYSDQGFDNRLTPSYRVGIVGVQVNIPLYSGGRVQATEREANARFEMARESLEGARREVERDARTAYLTTVSSYARIGSTNNEVRALERTLQAQQKSYEMGIATIVDVLNAQRLLRKSRSDQSKARYDYIRGLTILRVHAGTLSMRDIEEINGWMAREAQQAQRSSGARSGVVRNPEGAVLQSNAWLGPLAAAKPAADKAEAVAVGHEPAKLYSAPQVFRARMEPASPVNSMDEYLSTQFTSSAGAGHAPIEQRWRQALGLSVGGRCVAQPDRRYLGWRRPDVDASRGYYIE